MTTTDSSRVAGPAEDSSRPDRPRRHATGDPKSAPEAGPVGPDARARAPPGSPKAPGWVASAPGWPVTWAGR